MHHFEDRNGEMFAEDVRLSAIAEAVGTPCYIYSAATFTRHYRVFAGALEASLGTLVMLHTGEDTIFTPFARNHRLELGLLYRF